MNPRKTAYDLKHSYVQQKKIRAVQFGLADQAEILRGSVAHINSTEIYDPVSLMPKLNGVNDPRMGVVTNDQSCMTCFGDMVDCPGHFGHIELARPVYHVGLLDTIRKLLKVTCFQCSRVLIDDPDEKDNIKKIIYPKQRFYKVLSSVETAFRRKCNPETGGCGFKQPKYLKKAMMITVQHFDDSQSKVNQTVDMFAEESFRILERITPDDMTLLGIENPSNMIIRRLQVAPPAVRPAVSMGSYLRSEDDLTYSYQNIVKHNLILKTQMEKGGNQTTINELTGMVQYYVATLMNNQISGLPVHKHKSGKPLKAISQRLKGKEGRIRTNLMGKRGDFSARSVITPDPSLELDQLGVPIRVAVNMTIPEVVTQHNIDEMRNLVANGPSTWPGAKYIQRTDNRLIDLSLMQCRTDAHLEYGYIVERHLKNGDFVLFNRQPSLHKMSTMGHRIKVLPYNTFRLNLSVTTPYNADFDGDEMNMFVPQSLETKAEVKEIMHVPRQIVTPQANKPCMGIVQDSLLGVYKFTQRDVFLTKDTAMQLLMNLTEGEDYCQNPYNLPTPSIIKPQPLWTGKQIITILLPNVNIIRGQTMRDDGLPDFAPIRDKMVLIQDGEHLAGELSKQIVGTAAAGIVHVVFKEKGHLAAKDVLTNIQMVINAWLVEHGHTVGVQDACVTQETRRGVDDILAKHKHKVKKIIHKAQLGKLKQQPGKNMLDSFEYSVNQELNEARVQSGNLAFKNLSGANKIQNMVSAGSKGTNINISQIMACVGQQNVEGKRISFGFTHRTLPHFARYDYSPESKGFVSNNYIHGLEPSEFYFHAMGGREGLIDTAVKTAETGYIQRRLVKALEDVMVRYDSTVRNCQGGIVQFIYGEDGMAGESIEETRIDTVKLNDTEMKKRYHYQANEETLGSILDLVTLNSVVNDPSSQAAVQSEYEQIVKDRTTMRTELAKTGEEQVHLPINIQRLLQTCRQIFDIKKSLSGRNVVKSDLKPQYVVQEVEKLCKQLTVYPDATRTTTDAVILEANSFATQLVCIYIRACLASKKMILQERLTSKAFDWLVGEIKSKFEQSVVNPGEVVGSIAAHSLGEPATQMTLNTFHFAGVSSKNVTLGVPRLKEIINVAKNLKAPNMQIYLLPESRQSEFAVKNVLGTIEQTTLRDLVESSQVYYDPDPTQTVVEEDQALVSMYNEVVVPDENEGSDINSPWILRLVLGHKKMLMKQIDMDFIEQKLIDNLGDLVQIMHSDANTRNHVLRIRFRGLRDEEGDSAVQMIKECEYSILNEILLKGIPEIQKVYMKKYTEIEFCKKTGEMKEVQDNWMLETDGVCLKKILSQPGIDMTRTISNDIIEIKQVLGVEAARQALINEFRSVLGFYGIYVNYRHLSTLCDVMVQKGKLTSITRHGINRLDSGPLRKSSFEETVEILLEAAVHSEKDCLNGVTENIMMGQMAPIGSGSFDVVVDPRMLMKWGKDTDLWEEEGCGTPLMQQEMNQVGGGMTPCVGETPAGMMGGRTSEYGQTPGGMSMHDAAFSPGFNAVQSPGYVSPYGGYQSPGYQSPTSPNYGGRIKQQSPIYNSGTYAQNFASPVYNIGSGQGSSPQIQQSPNYMNSRAAIAQAQSPSYSPSSRSPYGTGPTGTVGNSSNVIKSNYSPSYSPSAQAHTPGSLNYSPNQISHQQHSPNYSPSISAARAGYSIQQSPNYTPSGGASAHAYGQITKTNYSPSYSPSSNVQKVFKSPHYSPNPLSGGGKSPYVQGKQGESPYVPGQGVRAAYMPNITAAEKQSPQYDVTSPVYKTEQQDQDKDQEQHPEQQE